MSDVGRKDFTEKAKKAMTPDSTKTTTEKIHDNVTGIGDKLARETQPNHDKSTSQEIGDKLGHSKDSHKEGGTLGSIVDSAKDAAGMGKDKHSV